jgi:hypothetical protein
MSDRAVRRTYPADLATLPPGAIRGGFSFFVALQSGAQIRQFCDGCHCVAGRAFLSLVVASSETMEPLAMRQAHELNGRQDRDHELRDDELDAACGGGNPSYDAIFAWGPYVRARVGGSEGGSFGLSRLKP